MPATPPRKSFYARITACVPLLVTVIVHVVLIAIAGYFVVSEQILGKKKNFEATAATENIVQKKVEHRLQVARKGGGSAGDSPVSASRIFSADKTALQLPEPPELKLAGASALAGMGFGAGTGGVGTGTGYSTGLGNGNSLGSGFMRMSFLGQTSQRASKVVFVLDVGIRMLDIKKGGFEAFSIVRQEMTKLISRLPPNAEFGVVLCQPNADDRDFKHTGKVTPFSTTLVPATINNKNRFFAWIKPINQTPETVGFDSIPEVTKWTPKELPNAGLDDDFFSPVWVRALRCALEMGPDTIYVVTGSAGEPSRIIKKSEMAEAHRWLDEVKADLKSRGMTLQSVEAARNAFVTKATAKLAEVNAQLKAKGQPPLLVPYIRRVFDADFQATLKQKGFSIVLDTKGWDSKEGRPLWVTGVSDWGLGDYAVTLMEISKLQSALLKERAALNISLFVGADEKPKEAIENLGKASSRNGGRFQLITTKKLKEIVGGDQQKK